MFAITTLNGDIICEFDNEIATFEKAYPFAVQIWDVVATSHRNCEGIKIVEFPPQADEDATPTVWLTINYVSHER